MADGPVGGFGRAALGRSHQLNFVCVCRRATADFGLVRVRDAKVRFVSIQYERSNPPYVLA